MDTFSGGFRSITEWCFAHDEVELELTWGVIKYLHWEMKWFFQSFDYGALKILKYDTLVK